MEGECEQEGGGEQREGSRDLPIVAGELARAPLLEERAAKWKKEVTTEQGRDFRV